MWALKDWHLTNQAHLPTKQHVLGVIKRKPNLEEIWRNQNLRLTSFHYRQSTLCLPLWLNTLTVLAIDWWKCQKWSQGVSETTWSFFYDRLNVVGTSPTDKWQKVTYCQAREDQHFWLTADWHCLEYTCLSHFPRILNHRSEPCHLSINTCRVADL